MNEAEYYLKNYGDQGGCYAASQRTPSEIFIILQMMQKLNSIIIIELLFHYLFKIVLSLKTSYAVLAIFLANGSPIFPSWNQRAKKVVSNNPELVDFAIGLTMNSVLNLPDGQVKSFEEFKLQKNCEINSPYQNVFGLVEMTFGLVYASFSLPEWQALKMTFFAPWKCSANVKCSTILYSLPKQFNLVPRSSRLTVQ